jgi:hypothetical protein
MLNTTGRFERLAAVAIRSSQSEILALAQQWNDQDVWTPCHVPLLATIKSS